MCGSKSIVFKFHKVYRWSKGLFAKNIMSGGTAARVSIFYFSKELKNDSSSKWDNITDIIPFTCAVIS